MRVHRVGRLTAVLVALVGLLVGPGSGLAHGVAHEREAHHAQEHAIDRGAHHRAPDHHEDVHADDVRSTRERVSAVTAPEEHAGHGHARVDDGVRARADGLSFLHAPQVTAPLVHEVIAAAGATLAFTATLRADHGTRSPPSLRAPPAA